MLSGQVYSRTFHPDRNGTSDPEAKRIADDLSRRANEARDVLMDPAKRRLYDLYGAKGLKQLTTVSKGGESFRAALEDLQEHRANRVAEPEGRVTVGLNMQDAIRALKDGRTFYPPEMSMLSVLHGFQHPISKTEAIFLYGFVGDSVSWGPTKKHEDGL
jgi:curved DNA-binding protein CbpA